MHSLFIGEKGLKLNLFQAGNRNFLGFAVDRLIEREGKRKRMEGERAGSSISFKYQERAFPSFG